MSKEQYVVKRICMADARGLLEEYHYLAKISKGFKSGFNYGCFTNDRLVGVCIFTSFPVPENVKGFFGLERSEQEGFYELSRLCLEPAVQKEEHNLASWFLSRALRMLKKEVRVRAVLSYADSEFHTGIVYAATNFRYYGLTASKKDFYEKKPEGHFEKQQRGAVSGKEGEWRPRTRKHIFLHVVDPTLTVLYKEQDWRSACGSLL